MNEIFSQILPYIITAIVGIITAVGTLVVSIINSKKSKYDYETKLSDERTKYIELEAKKLELEELTLKGSFIICPSCSSKIYTKDMIFYTKEVTEDVKVS